MTTAQLVGLIASLGGAFCWWAVKAIYKAGRIQASREAEENAARQTTRERMERVEVLLVDTHDETKSIGKGVAVLVHKVEGFDQRLTAVETRLDEHIAEHKEKQ